MKKKKVIPLVIIITLMVLGITSISIFSFYAREKKNDLKQTLSSDKVKEKNSKKDSKKKELEKKEEENENLEEKSVTEENEEFMKSDDSINSESTSSVSNSNTSLANNNNNSSSANDNLSNNSNNNNNNNNVIREQPPKTQKHNESVIQQPQQSQSQVDARSILLERLSQIGRTWDFSTENEAKMEVQNWKNRGFTAGYGFETFENLTAYYVYVNTPIIANDCGKVSHIVNWKNTSKNIEIIDYLVQNLHYSCKNRCSSTQCY